MARALRINLVPTPLANSPRREYQNRNTSREITRRDEIDQTHPKCGPPNAGVRLRHRPATGLPKGATFPGTFRERSSTDRSRRKPLVEVPETIKVCAVPASRATIWYRVGRCRLAARLGPTGSIDEKALV